MSKGMTCPHCGFKGTGWTKERGCLVWFLAIFFFPIGLLLLLLPGAYVCPTCNKTL